MEHTILVLLKDGRPRRWSVWLRARTRPLQIFRAKAIVLATGELVEPTKSRATVGNRPATVSPWLNEAGAELIDMEFVQFHPTA